MTIPVMRPWIGAEEAAAAAATVASGWVAQGPRVAEFERAFAASIGIGHGIAIVEDAACAVGAEYREHPVGARAEVAVFSFHPRKLLTTGEGGMIVTPDGELAARLRRLREHGMDASAAQRHVSRQPVIEHYLETGCNYRMTDIQAAVGLVQLGKLSALVARRRELAARYQRLLAKIPGAGMIDDPEYGQTNFQSFWLLLPEDAPTGRDELLRLLAVEGISARRGIMAAHSEPAYAHEGPWSLPVTERITADSLVLPLFHDLSLAEQDLVVDVMTDVLTK
jgi:dTDP-4-amino-4,6-dideoxygalactose transaminase